MLDVLFSIHIGVVLTKSLHARLVLDGQLVARLYIMHNTFFLDVLAALPIFFEVTESPPQAHHSVFPVPVHRDSAHMGLLNLFRAQIPISFH